MIPEKYRLKNTIKYPTSIIIGGLNRLGLEIADSLIEQGGYVIIVDSYTFDTATKLSVFPETALISFLDYSAIPHLDEDLRRLDYVFYFQHEAEDLNKKISTSEFLTLSNYLDATLSLTKKFDAKFLLTTSIKAHQLVLSRQDLDLEYGYGLSSSKHTIYTQMELQKYAESLAMEYFERDKLDVRITRLGEIIGEGVDFSKKTPFTEILIDAVTNNQIRLRKDGLDSEWYVHMLDAAYGIIKAQFSRITTGEIYSLTYETPFTNLSLAYKIQEYDSDAREIIFIDETDNLPALKLYKPAPNLSSVGWAPKVPFEKAVKQSLAAAKIYILENTDPTKKSKGTLVDKIKGFLAIAETDPMEVGEGGAVSRLIAERKKQDELRKSGIEAASLKLKSKKKRKKTFKEKVADNTWEFFRELSRAFNIFNNKSPAQIVAILVLLVLFLIFYVNYFSPAIALGRNLLVLSPELESAQNNLKKGDFNALKSNLDTIDFHFQDSKNIFIKFQGVADLLALSDQYKEIKKNLDAYSLFIDGAKNLSQGLAPFNNYLNSLENNTIQRAATDSYISLSGQGKDYSALFSNIDNYTPYVEDGISKIESSADQMNNVDFNLIPGFLTSNFASINKNLQTAAENIKQMYTVKYMNSILGMDSPKTYVFLILDNTIPTPIGGSISAYAMITVDRGSIVEVGVQSVDDAAFKFTSFNDNDMQKINLRRIGLKTKDSLSINDLTTVKDMNDFSSLINKVFKDTYSRDIAAVGTLNLTALDSLTKYINSVTGQTTQINSVEFGKQDLLAQLKQAQNGNTTLRTRNSVIAQVAAFALNRSIDAFKQNPAEIIGNLGQSAKNRDVLVTTNGLAYQDYVAVSDLNQTQFKNSNQFMDLSFNVSDPKYLGSDKLPSYTIAYEDSVGTDFTLNNKLNLKFPSLASTGLVSLCLPSNIADSAITVENLTSDRYAKVSLDNQKCVNMNVISEDQVTVTWQTQPIGKIVGGTNREISYGLAKIRGGNSTLDAKFSAATGLNIVNFVPQVGQNGNSFIFTSQLQDDLLAKFVLKN